MIGCSFVQRRSQRRLTNIYIGFSQNSTLRRRCKVRVILVTTPSLTFISATSWGRILAATGSVSLLPSSTATPAPTIDPTKVNVTFLPSDGTTPLAVLVNGEPEKVNEERAKEILSLEEFEVLVDLGMPGDGEARYWTCDFSYVSIPDIIKN